MQFTSLIAFALASISYANAAALFDRTYDPSPAVADSGCGSSGPLALGHYEWYIVVSCTPGDI